MRFLLCMHGLAEEQPLAEALRLYCLSVATCDFDFDFLCCRSAFTKLFRTGPLSLLYNFHNVFDQICLIQKCDILSKPAVKTKTNLIFFKF